MDNLPIADACGSYFDTRFLQAAEPQECFFGEGSSSNIVMDVVSIAIISCFIWGGGSAVWPSA